MGAAAALLKGPTVYDVPALKLRGVLELVGETPARFSGSKRNSPPNLIWCAPQILYMVTPALRVSVSLYSGARSPSDVYPPIVTVGNSRFDGPIPFCRYLGNPPLLSLKPYPAPLSPSPPPHL